MMLGIMLDCSRNGVRTVFSIKKLIDYMSVMGYDTLQLYTEDTLKADFDPYIGYLRGGYSQEEIKEIDLYAAQKGIELVPCVQTLGHLEKLFKWNKHREINDIDGILLIDEPKTYEYIDNMFALTSKCFTSKKINIGMDEAGFIGRGQYLDKFGYRAKEELMLRHLYKVVEIAKKYGYRPMMWADMFYRLGEKDCFESTEKYTFSQNIIQNIPKDVDLIYWNYFQRDEKIHLRKLQEHKMLKPANEIVYAGGAVTWSGFSPLNSIGIQSCKVALKMCRKEGIGNALVTLWGDDGTECSHLSVLPSLMCFAEFARGNFDESSIKEKFEKTFGISFDEFLKVDLPNTLDCSKLSKKGMEKLVAESEPVPENIVNWDVLSTSKIMLYSDYFLGFNDFGVSKGVSKIYEQISKELAPLTSGQFGYIFDTQKKLADVLVLKYELGVYTREFYQQGNREELKTLIECAYKPLIQKIEIFYEAFKKQWFLENKGYGFEIHAVRCGGLIQRTKDCIELLENYVDGAIDKIEELEETLLRVGWNGKGNPEWNTFYSKIASPNY